MKHTPQIRHPFREDHLSKHHCYPKARLRHEALKTDFPHLTVYLWRQKHDAWHKLFRSMTIDEIIIRLGWDISIYNNKLYREVFDCSRLEAILILKRLKRIKTRNYEPRYSNGSS